MTFTIGSAVKLSVFGSSHGNSVNSILEGIPSGMRVDTENIQKWLDYRRPGSSELTTQRKESDTVSVKSGLHDGLTDGSPLFFSIENSDAISSHYDEIKNKPRPGHADLTLWYKYGEARNYEGGGFLSGRMTAPMVAAGAVCMQLLESAGVSVVTWQNSIGGISLGDSREPESAESCYGFKSRIPDPEKDVEAERLIKSLIKDGNSIGGIISTSIRGIPEGVGEPVFGSVESTVSAFMFAIPGLKGIEFGSGFRFGSMTGREAVDEIVSSGGKIVTSGNNNGGILGGITNGMPVTFRVAMKPTSSIRSPLKTVDLRTGKEAELNVVGRHDPCISIRAVPVVQCMTAIAMCDLMKQAQLIPARIR